MDTIESIKQKIKSNSMNKSWVVIHSKKYWIAILTVLFGIQAVVGVIVGTFLLYHGFNEGGVDIVFVILGILSVIMALFGCLKLFQYLGMLLSNNYFILTEDALFIKRGGRCCYIVYEKLSKLKLVIDRGIYQSIAYTDPDSGFEETILKDRVFGAPQDLFQIIKTKIN